MTDRRKSGHRSRHSGPASKSHRRHEQSKGRDSSSQSSDSSDVSDRSSGSAADQRRYKREKKLHPKLARCCRKEIARLEKRKANRPAATHIMETLHDAVDGVKISNLVAGYIVCSRHQGGLAHRQPVSSLPSGSGSEAVFRRSDLERCCRREYDRLAEERRGGFSPGPRKDMQAMLAGRKVCELHHYHQRLAAEEEYRHKLPASSSSGYKTFDHVRDRHHKHQTHHGKSRQGHRHREEKERKERKRHRRPELQKSPNRRAERRKEDAKYPAGTTALHLLGSKFPLLSVFHHIAYMAFKDGVPKPVSLMPKKDQARYRKVAQRRQSNGKRRR